MHEPYFQSSVLKASIRWFFLVLHLLGVFALVLLIAFRSHAKTITFGSTPEQIRIKYGGPTILRFLKPVQTITGANRLQIKPANDTDPSYAVLAVTPHFTNGVNDVSFFLSDGSVIKTKIIVTSKDENGMDSVYDFKPKNGESSNDDAAPKLSEVELLKAMINDAQVSGYQVSKTSQFISSKESNISIELLRIYKGSQFNGYVFTVTNKSWSKIIHLDVRQITVGQADLAILSQADELELFPKGKGIHQTFLRVVTKSSASIQDIIVPMESETQFTEKNKSKNKDNGEDQL
jgi:hypothetical protein